MPSRTLNRGRAVLVAAIATTVLAPASLAEAKSPTATLRNQIASLKHQITGLSGQLEALNRRFAALEGRQLPAGLPPVGPAGGALAGSFPNPQLANNAVGTTQLAPKAVGTQQLALNSVGEQNLQPNAVGAREIGSGAVGPRELASSSVGDSELTNGIFVQSNGKGVEPGTSQEASITCPLDHPRLISGGPEWGSDTDGTAIIYSVPTPSGDPNKTWVVKGRVDTGAKANVIFAEALCLA